jgi:hypothetical protein
MAGSIATLLIKIGADVSELHVNMGKAAKTVETTAKNIETTMSRVAKAIASAWVFKEVTQAAFAVVEFAGTITDMAARTGIGVKALQEFQYAGKLVGVSLDSIAAAATKLQNGLGSGDKSVLAGLDAIGLSFEAIKAKSPEDAFSAIVAQLARVKNQEDLVAVGTDLMGRGFADILPLIKSGLSETRAEAQRLGLVLGDETVAALDGLGDKIDTLKLKATALIAEGLGALITKIADTAQAADGMTGWLDKIVLGFDAVVFASSVAVGALARAGEMTLKIAGYAEPFGVVSGAVAGAIQKLKDVQVEAAGWIAAVVTVDRTHRSAAESVRNQTKTVGDLAVSYHVTQEELFKLNKAEHDLWFDMEMFAVKALKRQTEAVQTEMAAQRDSVVQAQKDILALIISQREKVAQLQGTGPSADQALVTASQKRGREATRLGEAAGPGFVEQTQEALELERQMFVSEFDKITETINKSFGTTIPAAIDNPAIHDASQRVAQGITNNFVGSFQTINGSVDACAEHIASVLGAVTQTDAYAKAGFFINEGFGTATTINQRAIAGTGRVIPATGLGSAVPALGGGGGAMSVVVNANNSWYDSPEGRNKLGAIVGQAVMAEFKRSGGRA